MPAVTRSIPRPLILTLATALALLPAVPSGARAQGPPTRADGAVYPGDDPAAVLRLKHGLIMRDEMRERRERAEAAREARRLVKLQKSGKKGVRTRPATPEEGDVLPGDRGGPPVQVSLPTGVSSVNAIPLNAPVNNRAGDAAGDTQAEEGVAMLGLNGVCAWNDGHAFGPSVDAQQAAYTNDGGATWTDIGPPPKPVGGRWASDPVVTVNEKTGAFYYCGLIDFNSTSQNGVAFAPGSFSGGVFSWGTPRTIRSGSNSLIAFDKEWMVADSSNGDLYATYTTFGATTDSIIFQRSTDGGLSWGPPITMNSGSSFGYVQGSRPCVGPGGEVYVTWNEAGPSYDWMKIRRSNDAGVSFGAEAIAGTEYANFGTGGPGFNRDHGVTFPSIAVDRSTGPHRGRVYVAWNESINMWDDGLGGLGALPETEANGTTGTANAFTPGQRITGSISPSSDLDYFSFTATQGTTYIFWSPVSAGLRYTMRIYCTDGIQRLTYGGDAYYGGQDGYTVWTAPATGTYYLRMGGVSYNTGTYTVYTGIDAPSVQDRARDTRDAMVAWSDNGVTWSPQVRVNDDVALYDNYLSEVAVSCEGYVYSLWFDFRDSPAGTCGGVANIYASRSTDGGVTWAPNQRVTSANTNFTTAGTNLQPNMGDYSGLAAGANVAMAWADGRNPDVDVYATALLATPVVSCPSPPTINSGQSTGLDFPLSNPDVMFGNTYALTLSCDHPSWTLTPPSQNLTLASGAGGLASFTVGVPDTSPSTVGTVCLTVAAQNGATCGSCCVPVTVIGVPSGVPPRGIAAFALGGAWPNPATRETGLSVSFSLPSGAPASLELLDMGGRRVLSREVGSLGPGSHVVSWQREAAGLSAGIYVVRLSQAGKSASSKVVLVR